MAGDVEQGSRDGLSRREMIKASAVAGAAAWTAPMIIDSLTSPAAAASGGALPTSCSYALIVFTFGGNTYVMKIQSGSASCAGDDSTSSDSEMSSFPCGGHTYDIPVTHIVRQDGSAITPYPGGSAACDALFTVSGSTITRDNAGVTILFAVSHHGPPGGGYLGSKFYPACPASPSSVTVNCG
jgi:hypothetical protein